jgi:hypothetical protein
VVFFRLCSFGVSCRALRVDRIIASGCGIFVAVGRIFLGQNVFLERIGLAPREKITNRVLSESLITQGGKADLG